MVQKMSTNNIINQWKSLDSKYRKDDIDKKFSEATVLLAECNNLGYYVDNGIPIFCWTDPNDIVLNGYVLAKWNQTVLVRKQGSYPQNHTDGTVVAYTNRTNGTKNYYRDNAFYDTSLQANKTYYYMLFSETTANTWNNLPTNKYDTSKVNMTWQLVKKFVASGRGAELFPVGTVFTVNHQEYNTSTGLSEKIAFRVVGHDQMPAADETIQHTMCLDMVDCLFKAQYDEAELLYALTEDTNAVAEKAYYTYNDSTYTQLVEGTDYQVGDNIPALSWYQKNVDDNRSNYGSNLFEASNILQWANSQEKAVQWFQKKTIFDIVSNSLTNKNGFLRYIDPEFLSVVQPAKIITVKSNFDGSGSSIVNAKFFLLSRTQVFGYTNNEYNENIQLSWYTDNQKRKKMEINGSSDIIWCLRSPVSYNSFRTYYVSATGEQHFGAANIQRGVSLACIIG